MVFIQYLYYVLSISSRSLFLMMMMTMNLVFAAGPTGLTLKLIHHDSLYPGNLTKLERMDRAFERLIHRQQKQLSSWDHQMKQANNSGIDTNALRPPVRVYDHSSYMVELGIGTFSNVGGSPREPPLIPSYYFFYFDTGSDLTWLQCESSRTGTPIEHTHYFNQEKGKYQGQYSLTYRPIVYNSTNRICQLYVRNNVPPEGHNFCGYRLEYADGASTEGVLATDTLTVGTEQIKDFVLGCGYRQYDDDFGTKPPGQNHVAGTMGLGGGISSFIVQLGRRRGQYKFEYCLREDDGNFDTVTFLRFGSDVKIYSRRGQVVQTTNTYIVRGETLQYVNVIGISVGGEPVVYPAGSNVFQAKQDGTGGCAFDSGTDLLELSREVYGPFRNHLVNFFSNRGTATSTTPPVGRGYDLCFRKTPSFDGYPTIVFHFSEAFFEIATEVAFASGRRNFCLAIPQSPLRYPMSVVFGSRHLVNHRILHDLSARTISWIDEDCSIDP